MDASLQPSLRLRNLSLKISFFNDIQHTPFYSVCTYFSTSTCSRSSCNLSVNLEKNIKYHKIAATQCEKTGLLTEKQPPVSMGSSSITKQAEAVHLYVRGRHLSLSTVVLNIRDW